MNHPARMRMAAAVAILLPLVLFGLMTAQGIGLNDDSAVYFRGAENPAGGMSSYQAPLYYLLLRVFAPLAGSMPAAAWWISAAGLAASAAAVWRLSAREGRSPGMRFAMSCTLTLAHLHQMLFVYAQTEAAYFPALLWTLALLARGTPTRRTVALAAACCAWAFATRFSGAALVAAGTLWMILGAPKEGRLARAGLFAGISALPMLLVVLARPGATGHTPGVHPPGAIVWEQLSIHLFSTFAPYKLLEFATWQMLLPLGAAAFAFLWRGAAPDERRAVLPHPLHAAAYLGLVLATMTWLDGALFMTERIAAPFVLGLLWYWIALAGSAWESGRSPARRGAALALLVLPLFTGSVRAAGLVPRLHREGIEYGSRAWRESPTLRLLRDLRGRLEVYTNAPAAVSVLTGSDDAKLLHYKHDRMTRKPLGGYPQRMRQLGEACAGNRALVIIFRLKNAGDRDFPAHLPDVPEILERTGCARLFELADGLVIGHPSQADGLAALLDAAGLAYRRPAP